MLEKQRCRAGCVNPCECNTLCALAPNNHAAILLDLKEASQALAAADRAIAVAPDFAEAWSNKGLALLGLEDTSTAVEGFEQAARLNPKNAAAERIGFAHGPELLGHVALQSVLALIARSGR